MRPMKTIFVAKRYLPYILYELRQHMKIPYKIIKIGANGNVESTSSYDQILELQANIREAKDEIKHCNKFIKEEEKEIESAKNCIESWKKEIKELRKKNEKEN